MLNQAVSKLPPNLKEAWSMHTVRHRWQRPTRLELNNWLKEKAEGHEKLGVLNSKAKNEEPVKSKTTKVFAAISQVTSKAQVKFKFPRCVLCKGLWICAVFKEKNATQRAKYVAEQKLCIACLNGNHSFRQCSRAKKCPMTLNRVKGFCQLQHLVSADVTSLLTLVLCDSVLTRSWVSSSLVNRLDLVGEPINLLISSFNSTTVVETQRFKFTVSSEPNNSDFVFPLCAYVKYNVLIGSESINIADLQNKYPQLAPSKPTQYTYEGVEVIIRQDYYHAVRTIEFIL